jgi:hypothetical protein
MLLMGLQFCAYCAARVESWIISRFSAFFSWAASVKSIPVRQYRRDPLQ